jgi:acyl-CoA hydrolase
LEIKTKVNSERNEVRRDNLVVEVKIEEERRKKSKGKTESGKATEMLTVLVPERENLGRKKCLFGERKKEEREKRLCV